MKAWSVHARLATEAKCVLKWNDTQVCGRALCRANEGPMNAVVAASSIGLGIAAFVLGCARVPPAGGGVVVVSAGIDDFVRGAVRQVDVRTFVPQAELQNGPAGHRQTFAQPTYPPR